MTLSAERSLPSRKTNLLRQIYKENNHGSKTPVIVFKNLSMFRKPYLCLEELLFVLRAFRGDGTFQVGGETDVHG